MFYKTWKLVLLSILALLIFAILANWRVLFWQMELFVFEKIYPTQTIHVDLDGDDNPELVKIVERHEYSFGEMWGESILCIMRKAGKVWEPVLIDRLVGDKILKYEIKDVDDDGYRDFVSWWTAGNLVKLHIYRWNGEYCTQLFSGQARDMKLGDIDGDGIEEIFEYFEKIDLPSEIVAQMYRWENMEYVLVKGGIPVEKDSKHGDRLILGRGKITVLK